VAALSWGAGDFGGGIAARRGPLLGIVIATQLVGAGLTLVVAVTRAEAVPPAWEIGWALIAGVFGGVGIMSLYHGLATGRMGVVAPISGVLAAAIPVALGIVLQGVPGPARVIGMILALVAVMLVSRAGGGGSRRDVGLGTLAGFGIAVFNIGVSRFSAGQVFAPLTIVRASEGILFVLIVLLGRRTWRLSRPILPLVILVGALDMGGNAFYILATQAGRLDVATILSSLYPVTTVILATLILRERIAGSQLAGVLLAIAAIVLIGAG
jgi:drug/metabolite transporter (DMT)-like permease